MLRGEHRDARQCSTLATGRSGSFASRRLCDAHFRCSLISGHSRGQSAGLERAKFGSRPSLDDEGFFAKQSCRKFKADDGPLARPKLTASALLGCAVCWTLKSH